MKKLIFLLFLFIGIVGYGQTNKLSFDYDASGNQILRSWCFGCHSKTMETAKEIENLTTEDLQKFSPDDVLSYYPNPVKELLYLKWDKINGETVTSIQLYNLNGQLIREFKDLTKSNDFSISFSNLPQNVYSLNLLYTNGEQKSIKIIKE